MPSAFYSHADGPVVHAAYRASALLAGHDATETLHLQALVELRQGSARRSIETLRRSIRRAPDDSRLWLMLGWVLAEVGELVESLAACRRAILLDPQDALLWPNMIWALDMNEHTTVGQRLAVRATFDALHCRPLRPSPLVYPNRPDPERTIRVGYISADFFRHSAAFTFSLPLRHHDRDRFHITCYDVTEYPPDAMTSLMRGAVDVWRPAGHLDDEQLAALIRSDGIDVLVDLSGVTAGARILAMARRPAPVQITAWGYAIGLGLSHMDYLLSDRILIPPEHVAQHTEEILYLPTFMAADIDAAGDGLPDLVDRPDRPVTFGYFGRAQKITDRMLAVWAQIILGCPDSRLIVKASDLRDPLHRDHILDLLAGLGVAGRRVEVRGESSRKEHLEQHNDIDVALDTSPVGGGTTTLDACMMGVPTVTLLGETVSGRVSASILTAIGETPLISPTLDDYMGKAVVLGEMIVSGEWAEFQRRSIRRAFLSSILCDGDLYTRGVESCYRDAWTRWCVQQRENAEVGNDRTAVVRVSE